MPATWRFVDQLSATPVTLLDLHDDAPFMVSKWEAKPPELRRSTTTSMLVDGSIDTASAFDDRVLSLTLDMQSATADQVAAAFQKLARILVAPRWLRYQAPSTTAPVFFRTKACSPAEVEEFMLLAERNKMVTLEIPAEPFAYGLPVVGAALVPNDPTDGGLRFSIPNGKGDVPAPLRMECQFAAATERVLIGASTTALVNGSGAFLEPFATEFPAGGWTVSAASDASAIGGSRAVATSNSTTDTRVAPGRLTFPDVAPGDYRLLVRMKATRAGGSTPTSLVSLAVLPDWPGASWSDAYWDARERDAVVPYRGGTWQWVDLGVMRLPGFSRQASALEPSVTSEAKVRFLATLAPGGTAGTEFSVDHAVLVPAPGADGADGRLMTAGWNLSSVSAPSKMVVSPDSEAVFSDFPGGASIGWSPLGGFPRVTPGTTTTVTLVQRLAQGGDSKAAVTTVTWSYHPRYLYLRGD